MTCLQRARAVAGAGRLLEQRLAAHSLLTDQACKNRREPAACRGNLLNHHKLRKSRDSQACRADSASVRTPWSVWADQGPAAGTRRG